MLHIWEEERIFKEEFSEAQLNELKANIQNAMDNHFEK
jgi:hypothetical protein